MEKKYAKIIILFIFACVFTFGGNFYASAASCSSNTDCGISGYTGNPMCIGNKIYQSYKTYTCVRPNTSSSRCRTSLRLKLKETCTTGQKCSNGACMGTQLSLISSSAPATVNLGDIFEVKCDFGVTQLPCITSIHGDNQCTFIKFEGSSAYFNCVANELGPKNNYCNLFASTQNDTRCVAQTNQIESTNVVAVCTDHDSKKCVSDAVYWFDSCGNQQELEQTCLSGQTCSEGECRNILCSSDSDCGANGYVDSPFCQTGDVYQNYATHACLNPGQSDSKCLTSVIVKLMADCSIDQTCSAGVCTGGLINLIYNSSLEKGTTIPDSWYQGFWGTNNAQFSYPVSGYTGNGASIKMTSYTDGDAKWVFNDVAVTAGDYYIFSDKYISDVETHVVVQYHYENNTFSYEEIGTAPASSAWQTFKAGFNVPSGVDTLTIFHLINRLGTLTIDDYSMIKTENLNVFNQGLVSLTFDDGWQSVYDNAIPILDANNFKSTQYIITNAIGDTTNGYMTFDEINSMHQNGHEIGSHTRTHADLTSASADLQSEVYGSLSDLLISFNNVNNLAFPYGKYNPTVKSFIKDAGYLGARTVDFGFNDKSADKFALKVQIVERGGICGSDTAPLTTLDQVKGWIDEANSNKTWLILVFHQIDNNNSNCYGTTHQMLQDIANYLKTTNTKVITVSQGLSSF